MSDPIKLGSQEFALKPLKLGQLRKLLDALEEMTDKSGSALIDSAAAVLVAGLPEAELSVEKVLDIEATVDDLNAAVAAVLKNAGLKPQLPGEALPQPGV